MDKEKLYLSIINNLRDGVYLVDTKRNITFWNKAAEDITGYKKEEIVGQRCQNNLLKHIDKEGNPLCLFGCPLHETITDGKQRTAQVFLRHKEGHRIPVQVNISPMTDDGTIVGAIEIFTQNSPVVYEDNLIEKLSGMAMNDQLTGVSNRRKMESYLEYRFNELKKFLREFCVIFLDIDNFGDFNNQHGHITGDNILRAITKSVNHSVRTTDLFGRWGGEEFIGVFEIKNNYETLHIAEKIRVLIAGTEIPHGEGSLSVTASLGATVARSDDSIDTIIERADMLMYQSKKRGKNCVTTDIT